MTTNALERSAEDRFTWNAEQERIIREQFADGCDDDELAVLLYNAKHRRLDPFLGHLRGIKRWNAAKGREVMAIQTSIDAFRLIADRTGRYGGGPAPEFRVETTKDGDRDLVCRFTVRKLAGTAETGFTWLDVTDEARWSEYVVKTKQGRPVRMWQDKPHIMLAKCAEARTLRRAFPEELGGLYTDDEMGQADNPAQEPKGPPPRPAPTVGEAVREVAEAEARDIRVGPEDLEKAEMAERIVQRDLDAARQGPVAKPEPVTHLYEPDEWQERRFVAAMDEAKGMPGLNEGLIRNWSQRAATCKSAEGYNVMLDEMEAAVGLTEKAEEPAGELFND